MLLVISFIPFMISLFILSHKRSALQVSLATFLFLLSFWQFDVFLLYSQDLFSTPTISFLFRLFHVGFLFVPLLIYYFSFSIHRAQKKLYNTHKVFDYLLNRTIFTILLLYSFAVYILNFTTWGISIFVIAQDSNHSPAHLFPVGGFSHYILITNLILLTCSIVILGLTTTTIRDLRIKKFYKYLGFISAIVLFNCIITGFAIIPLYVSSLDSIFTSMLLFLCYYNLQSRELTHINQELQEQSELLNTIININPSYILVRNNEDKIIHINAALSELFLKHPEQLIGRKVSEEKLQHLMKDSAYPGVKQFRDASNQDRLIQWKSYKMVQHKDHFIQLHFGIDVTDQKINERLILTTEKLKVIGEMAASVAHEIRNPLTTIRGLIQLIQENKTSDYASYDNLMLEEIDRVNQVLKELLILAKPPAVNKRINVEIHKELKNTSLLFQAMASKENKIILIENRAKTMPYIHVDRDHFKQIIINVLKNALEAIGPLGTVKMIIDIVEQNVRIRFVDNGCGISRARVHRLGEPYYTNKEKGTGIGLTVCYKLVREENGEIEIKSKEDWGTCVTMLFPLKSME